MRVSIEIEMHDRGYTVSREDLPESHYAERNKAFADEALGVLVQEIRRVLNG